MLLVSYTNNKSETHYRISLGIVPSHLYHNYPHLWNKCRRGGEGVQNQPKYGTGSVYASRAASSNFVRTLT